MDANKYSSEHYNDWLSLSKLTNKKVVDIVGYVTKDDNGDVYFAVANVIFEDNDTLIIDDYSGIDSPYVYGNALDNDLLETLYEED